MKSPRRRVDGFTIIEIVVTISVAGILMAIAVPAFNTFIQNQRLATVTNSLVLSLNFARSEAIKRDTATGITVCASTDQQNCNGAGWNDGWLVADVTNNSCTLQGVPKIGTQNTVSEVAGPGQLVLVFQSNGAAASAASFTICDSRGAAYAHSIDLSPTGRAVSSGTPGQTISGGALACP